MPKKCYYWVDKMTKLFLVFETWVPKSECPLVALRDTLAHCFKKANNNHHVVVIIFMCKWRTVTLETHPAVITYRQIRAYIEWRWNMITSVPYPWSRKKYVSAWSKNATMNFWKVCYFIVIGAHIWKYSLTLYLRNSESYQCWKKRTESLYFVQLCFVETKTCLFWSFTNCRRM